MFSLRHGSIPFLSFGVKRQTQIYVAFSQKQYVNSFIVTLPLEICSGIESIVLKPVLPSTSVDVPRLMQILELIPASRNFHT